MKAGLATCKCKPGFVGEDCRFPCPGMPHRGENGNQLQFQQGPCFGRGTCYLPPALKFSASSGDQDAKCMCEKNTHGEACDILCPKYNKKVCGGHGHRRPFHPDAGRAVQHEQGCLWELARETEIKKHVVEDGSGADGVGRLARCECDQEGGFHGADDSCRVSCPGAGWGGYGGGRNVCGGGLKWAKFMANHDGFTDGWKLNRFIADEVQVPARGQCHIHYKFGATDPRPNPRAGLCSCIDDWKGSHLNREIHSKHGVEMYHDTCDATRKPIVRVYRKEYHSTCVKHDPSEERACLQYSSKWEKKDDFMVSVVYRRSESGCTATAGVNVLEALGSPPNCCPKGGTSVGDFTGGRGLYWMEGQCKAHSDQKTMTGYPELNQRDAFLSAMKQRTKEAYRLGQSDTHVADVEPLEVENVRLRRETNVLKEQALEASASQQKQSAQQLMEIHALKEQLDVLKERQLGQSMSNKNK